MPPLIAAAIGFLLGRLAAGWAASMLSDMNDGGLVKCGHCARTVGRRQRWLSMTAYRCPCGSARAIRWPIGSAFMLSGLFAAFAWCLLNLHCQSIHEVRPGTSIEFSRLPFHLSLIFFLWVATLTDLLDYVIPDEVVYAGIAVALLAASLSGELQMIHIWVNWDAAVDGIRGPYLPEWMKHHQHLHGLTWSLAGSGIGFSLTWLVRRLSHAILGYPALGLGDATLMALIGAYIGWQPTLCVLAIAPLVSVLVGLVVRVATGRSFVAYGPYLACSAYIVVCSWRWLWVDGLLLRNIFSHWPSVTGLIAFSLVTLSVLLFAVRMFRRLPIDRGTR